MRKRNSQRERRRTPDVPEARREAAGAGRKHAAVAARLAAVVDGLQPGARLPGMRSLMRQFGVSQSTLDHALRDLDSRGLIARRWGSGIFVRDPAPARGDRLAVAVAVYDSADPFCALLTKGIERRLAAAGGLTILCNGQPRFQPDGETTRALQCPLAGTIFVPTTENIHNPDYVRTFSERPGSGKPPFVVVDVMIPGVTAPYVGFDNYNAFRDLAAAAIRSPLRFRQILFLGALENVTGTERVSGFKAGLKSGAAFAGAMRIANITSLRVDLPLAAADLRGQRPTLIISASPRILPPLLAFCHAQGLRIPDEVVIASVLEENFAASVVAPVLGWIKPSLKLGALAAERLLDRLAGKPVKPITKIPLERHTPDALRGIL